MSPIDAAVNLYSLRARKARLARRLGAHSWALAAWIAVMVLGVGVVGYATPFRRLSYFAFALGLGCFMYAMWYRGNLARLPRKRFLNH
jgi:hypothetical protein